MKILFLSAYYPPAAKGGAEISTHVLAQGLGRLGHEVTVVTHGTHASKARQGNVEVIRLPLRLQTKPLFERSAAQSDARALLKAGIDVTSFDIVHAHDFRSAMVVAELEVEHPVITVRDYAFIAGCTNNITANGDIDPGCQNQEWHCHRVQEAPFPRNIVRWWQYVHNKSYRRDVFAQFKRYVFISQAQREIIARSLSILGKQTIIFNPISPDYLATPTSTSQQRTLLYVGTIEMYKGVGLLLDAWHEIAAKLPNWRLVLVGQGAQRKEYERLVERWGLQYRTHFKGRVAWEKLIPVYDAADVVVAPHVWVEPFGRAVIEGMARGKIVVSARSGGPAEIITHGKTGLLFTRANTQDLSTQLLEAARMNHYDRREMQQSARKWVAEHLTADAIAKQHEAFYLA